jgi:hypothetical protein
VLLKIFRLFIIIDFGGPLIFLTPRLPCRLVSYHTSYSTIVTMTKSANTIEKSTVPIENFHHRTNIGSTHR